MKEFKGKAIYNPSGKAGEYSYWACNFYVGCSNGCTYCYLKKGRGKATLGGDKPTLKKCFRSVAHAKDVFEREMLQNWHELQKHGLFFSFTTDPMLPETIGLTLFAIELCLCADIPVKILTKRAIWVDGLLPSLDFTFKNFEGYRSKIAWGFTLTGCDELEQGASTNAERIEAMKTLHDAGFKTFASIEPIIDFDSSLEMIKETVAYCDLYKIGLESGKKYNREELIEFIEMIHALSLAFGLKVYWKDSVVKLASPFNPQDFPTSVPRDYNMFNQQ